MAEVLTLSNIDGQIHPQLYQSQSEVGTSSSTSSSTSFTDFNSLISFLFRKGNDEKDKNHATLVIINEDESKADRISKLDSLSFSDKKILLRYFFSHLNIIVLRFEDIAHNKGFLDKTVLTISSCIGERISRVETWTGTGNLNVNDVWAAESDSDQLALDGASSCGLIPTMSLVLSSTMNISHVTAKRVQHLNLLLNEEIEFITLLLNHEPAHLSKLCEYVGNWSFPAHELSNDDLVYCVYLMIKYSMDQLPKNSEFIKLNNNELLGFVFMVRDTYKNGNPFHNFRHATDVLQACFHFLIRLDCLPIPKQMQLDPSNEEITSNHVELELIATNQHISDTHPQLAKGRRSSTTNIGHLNPIETFGLLIAALGHDVGHPGVTNAFMTKYSSPTSLVYNGRSVLELFHSSVFINKLLAINWPNLLQVCMDSDSQLTMRELIVSCILATDMAEHFQYIGKIGMFKDDIKSSPESKVKLISSLLIKCADISNVTRPLRVSSQWAFVLSREFEEVATLEKKLTSSSTSTILLEPEYSKLPSTLEKIIELQPDIYKGQIFFINTFAENLFKSVVEILPELQYTCDIILSNKAYWFECKEKDI